MNIGNYGDETDLQGTLTDGSTTLPAVSFISDSSTGLYKTPQGLGVSVQGTATLDIRNNALISNVNVLEPYNVLYHGMDNTGQTNCSANVDSNYCICLNRS